MSVKVLPAMSKFPQPCSVCGKLTAGEARCEVHQREYIRQRNSRNADRPSRQAHKSELYNYAYRKQAKLVRESATHCHICKQPFVEGDRIEADHLLPGDPGSPLAPAHRICNQRRGNKPL